MELEIFQVDAFCSEVFKGNPAAVCFLDNWIADELMQKIAAENNLSETVFYIQQNEEYEIRWFTPTTEVDLCGHATLATAYVEFFIKKNPLSTLTFHSKSGKLTVEKEGENMVLDFPRDYFEPIEILPEFTQAFGYTPIEAYKCSHDILLVFESEAIIQQLNVNFHLISQIDCRGISVTAQGNDCDFVSRFFAPQSGIFEDPVTGSAHTFLTPFWVKKLNKQKLNAQQISSRKGNLTCELIDNRVKIGGKATLYLQGKIFF